MISVMSKKKPGGGGANQDEGFRLGDTERCLSDSLSFIYLRQGLVEFLVLSIDI